MSQEMYFFRFNTELASTKLPQRLLVKGEGSFEKYLNKKKSLKSYTISDEVNISLEEIIEKVGNNIEEITFQELSDITYWFYEKYFENGLDSKSIKKLKEEYENDLLQNGIIQFYELTSSSSQVSAFLEVMWDFESLSKIKIGYDCHSEQFMEFLNFFICYACELSLFLSVHDNDYSHCEEQFELEEKIKLIGIESNAHKWAILCLEKKRNELTSLINHTSKILKENNKINLNDCYGNNEDENDLIRELTSERDRLYRPTWTTMYIEKMKEKLNGCLGQIKIDHSY